MDFFFWESLSFYGITLFPSRSFSFFLLLLWLQFFVLISCCKLLFGENRVKYCNDIEIIIFVFLILHKFLFVYLRLQNKKKAKQKEGKQDIKKKKMKRKIFHSILIKLSHAEVKIKNLCLIWFTTWVVGCWPHCVAWG